MNMAKKGWQLRKKKDCRLQKKAENGLFARKVLSCRRKGERDNIKNEGYRRIENCFRHEEKQK